MFLANSRYAQVAAVTTKLSTGETVVALKRRQLTPAVGARQSVLSGDRLDVIADQQYAEASWFWHIADANTALDSRDLVAEPGDTLNVPQA